DMQAGDAVHLLGTRDWALHYTFIRERIEGRSPLDRCDPAQASLFNLGWYEFSQREYFEVQTRRYLLGTLDSYAGGGPKTLDFTYGDQIVAEQMQHAFFGVAANLDAEDVHDWSVHPSEPRQTAELLRIDGRLPLSSENAPFKDLHYQPLTEGVSFGVLEFVSAGELEQAALGPDYIVITDAVPNDIPFVGGLITEAFQTPLAHVNVLSQNRKTPNMALHDARNDPNVAPWLGKLVRPEGSQLRFFVPSGGPGEGEGSKGSRRPSGARGAPAA